MYMYMEPTIFLHKNFISNISVNPPVVNSVLYKKVPDKVFEIPREKECSFLIKNNYKIAQLKKICKHYNVISSGNKEVLRKRLYNLLRLSSNVRKIQNCCKHYLLRKYNNLRGPARYNRTLCVNETDFYSMDDLADIPYEQFYSFQDSDKKIYGFDVKSLYKLYSKSRKKENPYNRKEIPIYVMEQIKSLLKLSKISTKFSNGGNSIVIEDVEEVLTQEQRIAARALDIFQKIDLHGHITNTDWFMTLEKNQLIKFIRVLSDIWEYRAQLSHITKRNICPPYGNPFGLINMGALQTCSIEFLKMMSLTVMEKLVTSGVTSSMRSLGAMYVLCGLTLVNLDAANSLPWLYESVAEA
jgi:hypothetical protein